MSVEYRIMHCHIHFITQLLTKRCDYHFKVIAGPLYMNINSPPISFSGTIHFMQTLVLEGHPKPDDTISILAVGGVGGGT